MKIIRLTTTAVIVTLICALCPLSCSEKGKAAMKALHGKAEDKLVAVAGEGEVALKLMNTNEPIWSH